jgi:hypothetical protein
VVAAVINLFLLYEAVLYVISAVRVSRTVLPGLRRIAHVMLGRYQVHQIRYLSALEGRAERIDIEIVDSSHSSSHRQKSTADEEGRFPRFLNAVSRRARSLRIGRSHKTTQKLELTDLSSLAKNDHAALAQRTAGSAKSAFGSDFGGGGAPSRPPEGLRNEASDNSAVIFRSDRSSEKLQSGKSSKM